MCCDGDYTNQRHTVIRVCLNFQRGELKKTRREYARYSKHDISTDDGRVDRSSNCHLHAAWSVCPQIGDNQEDLEGPLSIVMTPRIQTSTTSSHSSEYFSCSTAR